MSANDTVDAQHMASAIALAKRGQGYVEPNPMVGCIVIKNRRVVGQGYHRRYGSHHAEVNALRQAGSAARRSCVYVTLEPCNHHDKTPPCTEALIAAGVRRVVFGTRDPNPAVNGKGIRRLRRAGIDVQRIADPSQAQALIAPYTTGIVHQRPYVIAKWAQSLDGKIATAKRDSKWISTVASRRVVQRIRSRVDAIVIGSETLVRDDPALTCREIKPRRVATRVVLDTRLRMPLKSRLVQTANRIPVVVFTQPSQAQGSKARRLGASGVRVLSARLAGGRLSIAHVFKQLYVLGMSNVLIEGGGQLLGSCFDADIVDEGYCFISPRIIGGSEAVTAIAGRGRPTVLSAAPLESIRLRRIGRDWLAHFGRSLHLSQ